MLDGWFKIGNHWSEEFQMFLTKPPEKKKAQRMITLDEVSGVNKLVITDKGYYTLNVSMFHQICIQSSLSKI